MVRAKHVGEARGFQLDNVLAAGLFRYKKQDADAAAISGGDAGKLAQGDEGRAIDACKSHIGDHQGPFPGFQLGQEHLGIGNDADAPSLRIQNLLDRTPTRGIVVEDENAHLLKGWSRTSTHNTEYTTSAARMGPEARGCAVSGNGGRAMIEALRVRPLLTNHIVAAGEKTLQARAIPKDSIDAWTMPRITPIEEDLEAVPRPLRGAA
jgi:hypothetical protein